MPSKDVLPGDISEARFQEVQQQLSQVLGVEPSFNQVLMEVGRAALQRQNYSEALNAFDAIPADDRSYGLSAMVLKGELLVKLNRATEAEAALRKAWEAHTTGVVNEDVLSASRWLTYLLSVELRFVERQQHLEELHAIAAHSIDDSKQLCFPHLLIWRSAVGRKKLREFLDQDPTNQILQLAYARYLTAEGDTDSAMLILHAILEREPTNRDCVAGIAECYFENGDNKSLEDLFRKFPDKPDDPWLLTEMRGLAAADSGDYEKAVALLRRVLEIFPAKPECHMKIYQALRQSDDLSETREFEKKATILAEMRVAMPKLRPANQAAIQKFVSQCYEAGFEDAGAIFAQHLADKSNLQ